MLPYREPPTLSCIARPCKHRLRGMHFSSRVFSLAVCPHPIWQGGVLGTLGRRQPQSKRDGGGGADRASNQRAGHRDSLRMSWWKWWMANGWGRWKLITLADKTWTGGYKAQMRTTNAEKNYEVGSYNIGKVEREKCEGDHEKTFFLWYWFSR